jgi:hypothetical protein
LATFIKAEVRHSSHEKNKYSNTQLTQKETKTNKHL